MNGQHRCVRLVGATGKLRTTMFNDREHLVVPVTAMVEGVVWAVNAPHPEFVAAEELAVTPQQWDGRPCFAGHPEVDGKQVDGNDPLIFQSSFGTVFHTASAEQILSTRRLTCEAYLDPVKAEAVGPKAVSVIERLRAGKTVEVSVGTYMVPVPEEGEWNGKPFAARWTDIVSNHLAFLGENETGACSVEAGCGALRSARHFITEEGITQEEPMEVPQEHRGLRERFLSLLKTQVREAEGLSASDLYRNLDKALRGSAIGYVNVDDIFPDDGVVIFCTRPEEEYLTWRRSYEVAADGEVTLTGEAEQVRPVTRYEVVTAAAKEPTAASTTPSPCGCATGTATTQPQERHMKDSTKTLIEGSNGKFKEADAAWLDAIPEEHLAAFSATPEPAATEPTATAPTTASAGAPNAEGTTPAATPTTPALATLSEADFMRIAPPSVKAVIQRVQEADAQRRSLLVTALGVAQKAYSEAELKTLELSTLEKLAAVAGIGQDHGGDVDFGVRRVATSQPTEPKPLPDGYETAIAARRAQSGASTSAAQ